MLAASTDYISASGIAKYLSEPCRSSLRFEILEETASTNLTAREAGERGEGSGLVVIARRQTHGRGRRGRKFFSDGGGIYMSVLLRRPGMTGAAAARLTTNAALAVARRSRRRRRWRRRGRRQVLSRSRRSGRRRRVSSG